MDAGRSVLGHAEEYQKLKSELESGGKVINTIYGGEMNKIYEERKALEEQKKKSLQVQEKIKKIIWISGRCGYGKTTFTDSIIKEFKEENKNIKPSSVRVRRRRVFSESDV